jgi:hypothetical protein
MKIREEEIQAGMEVVAAVGTHINQTKLINDSLN